MPAAAEIFTEAPVWEGVRGVWKPLFGNFEAEGVSVEWHDFECDEVVNWSESFHPGSMEICINISGRGTIRQEKSRATIINPRTVAHYLPGRPAMRADRLASQHHRFLTIEMSRKWLESVIGSIADRARPEVRDFIQGGARDYKIRPAPLHAAVRKAAEEMSHPPLEGAARSLWFHARILEIASHLLFQSDSEFFCERQKRLAHERIDQVKQMLAGELETPPTLAEIGRRAGCSPFYLSRIFSEHTGMTITRYIRNLRIERAAELLRQGHYNVTEAATAVGYSSLSHFSKAFAEVYGTCPCAFNLVQK